MISEKARRQANETIQEISQALNDEKFCAFATEKNVKMLLDIVRLLEDICGHQ